MNYFQGSDLQVYFIIMVYRFIAAMLATRIEYGLGTLDFLGFSRYTLEGGSSDGILYAVS